MAGLKVIILAAGKSTRMKSALPKVLHEVAGKPILAYVLEQAQSLDPSGIVVVAGHQADRVKGAFTGLPKTSFVIQEPQLGTAHAVMQAREALQQAAASDEDVLVLCGDVPLLKHDSLARFHAEFKESGAAASVLTAIYHDPTGYGRIVRDGSGSLRQIVEEKDCLPEFRSIKECNTGTYLFKAGFLLSTLDSIKPNNAQKEYYLTDAVQVLFLQDKPVATTVLEAQEEVIGINTRRDLAMADAIARGWIMLDLLENKGVSLVDPATTYIEADVEIGQDTVVLPFSCIRRGVKIGKGCTVGPFAHLRPGTVMEDGTKIGAFVEAKNAHLMEGATAGHMAYLGDVSIGRDVNIGAGTVVANYDGRKKHKTVIEDEAFIGCGTVLVAPVTIGKGAITGANTVVPKNKDVRAGATVVGAPAREIGKK